MMRRMMEVNFIGTYLTARAALPIFRRQASGHLTIVSSIVGQRGIPAMSAYGATKAAQVGFAESLRTEFAGTAIEVSIVFPVSTQTEFRYAMNRDFGHSVAGLGPKQTVDERGEGRWSMAFDGRGRRFIPRVGARPRPSERDRARVHRSARQEYGRRRVEPAAPTSEDFVRFRRERSSWRNGWSGRRSAGA